MVVHAAGVSAPDIFCKSICRKRDDRDRLCLRVRTAADRLRCLITVQDRHLNIHQDQSIGAGGAVCKQFQCFFAVDGAVAADAAAF